MEISRAGYFLIFILTLSLISCEREKNADALVKIEEIDGHWQFTIKDKVHAIKGVSGHAYLREAASIGINTIRTYDTTHLQAILDTAEFYNIKVVAGIWLPKSHEQWLYGNEEYTQKLSKELALLGRKYRNHPALLSWCLGNELVYYNLFDFKFPGTYNQLLDSLRAGDPNHPIGTALANFGQKAALNFALKISDLDYYLINTFGRLRELEEDMSRLFFIADKPFLIGEFGENGPWEAEWTKWSAPLEPNSRRKAALLARRFQELPSDNPHYLGALVFNWGWRHEQTHTWFNVFSEKGERNALYHFLADKYGGQKPQSNLLEIDTLLIDGTGNYNSFWFDKNQSHTAALRLTNQSAVGFHVEWSLRTEDWFFLKGDTPPAVAGYIQKSKDPKLIVFTTPAKTGPYRLFVKVTDSLGNFATANLPFYVVQ